MRCWRVIAAAVAATGLLPAAAPAAARRAPVGQAAPAVDIAAAVVATTAAPATVPAPAGAALDPGSSTAAVLDHAELLLAGECMVARGFAFAVPDRGGDPNARYVATLPPARRTGYLRAFFGEPAGRITATMPGGAVLATSTDGCLARARRTLYRDLERWFAIDALLGNAGVGNPGIGNAGGTPSGVAPVDVAWYRSTVAAAVVAARRLLSPPGPGPARLLSASSGGGETGLPSAPPVGQARLAAAPAPVSRYRQIGPGWSTGDCSAGYLCAYQGISASGSGVAFYADAWNWATIPARYAWIDNNSSSWVNLGISSVGSVRLFQYPGGFGVNRCLRRGYWVDHDDELAGRVSAIVWVRSCTGRVQFVDQAPGVPAPG